MIGDFIMTANRTPQKAHVFKKVTLESSSTYRLGTAHSTAITFAIVDTMLQVNRKAILLTVDHGVNFAFSESMDQWPSPQTWLRVFLMFVRVRDTSSASGKILVACSCPSTKETEKKTDSFNDYRTMLQLISPSNLS